MKNILLVLFLIGSFSCKDTGYEYVVPDTTAVKVQKSFSAVKELITDSDPTDILWVIDNSGSMDKIQSNIVKNTELFMKDFVVNKTINWKMGLLSTDYDYSPDKPYLGFDDLFDYTSSDPVSVFQAAVKKLGLSGAGTEKMMEPILEHLKSYPDFLRPEAQLAVIMVSDEYEQTQDSYITKEDFLQELIRKKGSRRLLKFYAIMNAVDLNCPKDYSDQVNYFGSKYEYLVNETGGSYFKACADEFGKELSKISEDIVSSLMNSKYYLDKRPKVETIKVLFEGEEIPSVDPEGKRKWFYNQNLNCLVFTDLSFLPVDDENAMLDVTYDIDNGF